jgi:hypothetical protein
MVWWKGWNGENDMTEKDWEERAGAQARSMLNALPWQTSCPDEDGDLTSGQYDGDYSQEHQDELNKRLEEDEYYEAEQTESMGQIFRGWLDGFGG